MYHQGNEHTTGGIEGGRQALVNQILVIKSATPAIPFDTPVTRMDKVSLAMFKERPNEAVMTLRKCDKTVRGLFLLSFSFAHMLHGSAGAPERIIFKSEIQIH